MSSKSSEQVAFSIIKDLPPEDRRLIRQWRENTACDWATALLASGALSSRGRRTPAEDTRERLRREAAEELELWERLVSPPDEVSRRREAAEHESAHGVVAQALGSNVSVAALGADGSGLCRFSRAGLTDLQRAAVMLAPELWINNFRAMQFSRGATGCAQDRRDAAATGADLPQATRLAFEILRDNRDAVLKLADKIDTDGHWFGPTAG